MFCSGNIEDPEEVLEWLQKHKSSSSIEEVTDEILIDLVQSHEYVGVYFKVIKFEKKMYIISFLV